MNKVGSVSSSQYNLVSDLIEESTSQDQRNQKIQSLFNETSNSLDNNGSKISPELTTEIKKEEPLTASSLTELLIEFGLVKLNLDEFSIDDTPLESAIESGNTSVVRTLLKYYNTEAHIQNAFMSAAYVGNIEILKMCLDKGADINKGYCYGISNNNDFTALMAVTFMGKVDAIKFLIDQGADVNAIESNEQRSALAIATDYGKIEAFKILLENGAMPVYNFSSTFYDKNETEILNIRQINILEFAHMDVDFIKKLIESSSILDHNEFLDSALLETCKLNSVEATQFLLDLGADVDFKTVNNDSSLRCALSFYEVWYGDRKELVKLLLVNGAQPSTIDELERIEELGLRDYIQYGGSLKAS